MAGTGAVGSGNSNVHLVLVVSGGKVTSYPVLELDEVYADYQLEHVLEAQWTACEKRDDKTIAKHLRLLQVSLN